MNQRRMILAVVTIGIVSAATWAWRESSQKADVALTRVKAPSSIQEAFHQPAATPAVAGEAAQVSGQQPPLAPPPAVAPVVDPTAVSASAEAPNVDSPEPAERKFARGGRVDEAIQH